VNPAQDVDTVKLIYKPVARRVTHQVLVDRNRSRNQPEKGRFACFEVERLFAEVWDVYCELMPNESRHPTNGSRMNMRKTCLTVALFAVFSAAGIERSYATELVSEISWKTYDKWRLFSGMNKQVQPEAAPQAAPEAAPQAAPEAAPQAAPQIDYERPVPLSVPYYFPGGYRQVASRPRDRVAHRPGVAR
jgi:hypothetical protein